MRLFEVLSFLFCIEMAEILHVELSLALFIIDGAGSICEDAL